MWEVGGASGRAKAAESRLDDDSRWPTAARALVELRRHMPPIMMEMMLTLFPVMYIMKPCMRKPLAGACAISIAICVCGRAVGWMGG